MWVAKFVDVTVSGDSLERPPKLGPSGECGLADEASPSSPNLCLADPIPEGISPLFVEPMMGVSGEIPHDIDHGASLAASKPLPLGVLQSDQNP